MATRPRYPLTGQGTRCPYCAGQKLSYERSLAAVAPHLVEEWDEEREWDKSASEVMAKTCKTRLLVDMH